MSWRLGSHRCLGLESLPALLLKSVLPQQQALSSNALSSGSELAMTLLGTARGCQQAPHSLRHPPCTVVMVMCVSTPHRPSVR